jgi:cysteine desulfurase
VDGRGIVDPDRIQSALRPETKVISVMHANNEVGTIQPIAEIARIAAEAGVAMHSDGVQAAGKIRVSVADLGVALYSISGHKIGAPKGIGVLYVRKATALQPRMFGGRHERERRAGTENVAGAVALGRAAQWIAEKGDAENRRQGALRDRLEQSILDRIPDTRVNGAGAARVPNTTNIRFDGIDSDALLIALDLKGFAVSSGAACSSGAPEPSHVLLAMGLSRLEARSSIRFSVGRSNTVEQVDALVDALVDSVTHLRKLAPSYA